MLQPARPTLDGGRVLGCKGNNQLTRKMNYSAYSVAISNEPVYYGTECTQADADRIAETLTQMIKAEFQGIAVNTSGTKTTGPDSAVIDEINEWVSENWTKAL